MKQLNMVTAELRSRALANESQVQEAHICGLRMKLGALNRYRNTALFPAPPMLFLGERLQDRNTATTSVSLRHS